MVVPLLTMKAASSPCHPSHAGAGMLHTKFFPKTAEWRVLTCTDVGNGRGEGGGGGTSKKR